MFSRINKWRLRPKVMIAAAIAGAFLMSASFAVVFNSQGNSGEQLAEAASRSAFSPTELEPILPRVFRLRYPSTGRPRRFEGTGC